jgi:HSP20 family protein
MNRLFEESLLRGRPLEPAIDSSTWSPLADVYETPESFVVLMEIPGLSEEDVDVEVEADQITLRGERRMTPQARPESFHRMERSYGHFSRTFRFGAEVEPGEVKAHFRDGLLRLDLPKATPRGTWRSRREGSE